MNRQNHFTNRTANFSTGFLLTIYTKINRIKHG